MLQVVQILARMGKNNPALIGEAGVGKTAIVEGLAQRIAAGKNLPGKHIVELSLSSLVGGTKYRGGFEEQLNGLIAELRAHPEVILFIDPHFGGRRSLKFGLCSRKMRSSYCAK